MPAEALLDKTFHALADPSRRSIVVRLSEGPASVSQLAEPLLRPEGSEREGYVPNVVYTCGALLHRERLILPYGISDSDTTIVTLEIDRLLEKLAASAVKN